MFSFKTLERRLLEINHLWSPCVNLICSPCTNYALARASLSFIWCSGVVFIFYETLSVQMSADMQGKIGYG